MNQEKGLAYVTGASIEVEGEFMFLSAKLEIDKPGVDRGLVGQRIHSSKILSIDVQKQEVTTQNTIYKMIPYSMVETYKVICGR